MTHTDIAELQQTATDEHFIAAWFALIDEAFPTPTNAAVTSWQVTENGDWFYVGTRTLALDA